MENVIIQNEKTFTLAEITATHKTLPANNYLLVYDEVKDTYYLTLQEEFSIPKKIYGNYSYIEKWKKSFEVTSKNLGVLLSGYKGGGKTLIAQEFCRSM